jgi:putative acetyltransferase
VSVSSEEYNKCAKRVEPLIKIQIKCVHSRLIFDISSTIFLAFSSYISENEGMDIRPEVPEDAEAVRRVNTAAFGRSAEARLVDALRENGKALLSLVALREETIVGHIFFSPVTISGEKGTSTAVGLGPMTVAPQCQRQGVGSALVETGLKLLRSQGYKGVVVLGHPEFYTRFGFIPASRYGLSCIYPVPDEVFMALELEEGDFSANAGVVTYAPEFDSV